MGGIPLRDRGHDLRRLRRALQAGLSVYPAVARPRRGDRDRSTGRRSLRVGAEARHAREGLRPLARGARWCARPDRLAALRRRRRVLPAARVRRGLETLAVADLIEVETERLDSPFRSVGRPACRLVETARSRIVVEHPEVRVAVAQLSQPLLAGLDERASESGAPVAGMDVDGVQLSVPFVVVGPSDRDVADDLAVELGDQRWVAPMHLRPLVDRERAQPVGRKCVGINGLPASYLNQRDSFGIGRCPRADHSAEPTLGPVKRIALLGATGSIGRQALEIIDAQPELELVAAGSGSTPIEGLAPLTQVGGDLTELLERAVPDLVLNAIVGFAGLPATLWALEHGVDLALANKESLVAAGELALAAQARGGGRLLPVDSEHSAVLQCLDGRAPETVHSVVLTASGGPFRGRNRSELEDVTPEDALDHPTWRMGPKITVDSATLANKGLEVIEAHFLFGLPYDRIEVVIQPTSVVHALVRLRDGSSLAHLGYPDMRVPISYALTYPDRSRTDLPQLDFTSGLVLQFEPVDDEAFPMLGLARRAGQAGGTYPCAFNAANEVAVAAFLDGRLPFLGISELVERTMEQVDGAAAADLNELVEADAQARRLAEEALVAA